MMDLTKVRLRRTSKIIVSGPPCHGEPSWREEVSLPWRTTPRIQQTVRKDCKKRNASPTESLTQVEATVTPREAYVLAQQWHFQSTWSMLQEAWESSPCAQWVGQPLQGLYRVSPDDPHVTTLAKHVRHESLRNRTVGKKGWPRAVG